MHPIVVLGPSEDTWLDKIKRVVERECNKRKQQEQQSDDIIAEFIVPDGMSHLEARDAVNSVCAEIGDLSLAGRVLIHPGLSEWCKQNMVSALERINAEYQNGQPPPPCMPV